ncbi:MAG: thiosulfate oxidation carrier protein SoxY [gamma proteobacterium symbiont of Ctena orbiculata]|nr:MAG: thiosulfate oxidation carrier protein SoxY [gamma proteobacterium symbiont of Ctena orbiculata]
MTPNTKRRDFLKVALIMGLAGSTFATGLFAPRYVLAGWNRKAFESKHVNDALKNGFGSLDIVMSDNINIEAPDIAANGAIVPVSVVAKLSAVEAIALLSEKNPRPLCAIFHPRAGIRPKMSVRIKMGQSGDVIAIVKSEGKLYMARRSIKVTAGGCA